MTRFTFSLCIFLILTLSIKHSKAQSPVDPALAASLQAKIESFLTTYDLPGISVTVMLPGNQIWSGAAGLSDIYSYEPMDTSNLFQMASVNKLFTAAMIFQLMEEGLLSLDDSVGMYLPPMTNVPSSTTIANLLKHKSGIADIVTYPTIFYEWINHPDSIWPHLQTIEAFVTEPLFTQGASWGYCNTNYILLGMIIEDVTGNTFAEELHDRFCAPYGLNQVFFAPDDVVAGPETPGWTSFTTVGVYDTDASLILNDCSASMFFTAGSIIAKPADVARFNRLLFSGKIISDSSLGIMKTCTNVNFGDGCNGYGYGTMRYVIAGRTYYGHSGDVNGFTQMSVHNMSDSVTLTMSVNRNYAPRGTMAPQLFSIIFQSILSAIDEAGNAIHTLGVYPNPATDHVNVVMNGSGKKQQIRLINEWGQTVFESTTQPGVKGEMMIDVSQMNRGIYLLQLVSDELVETQRVVIQ